MLIDEVPAAWTQPNMMEGLASKFTRIAIDLDHDLLIERSPILEARVCKFGSNSNGKDGQSSSYLLTLVHIAFMPETRWNLSAHSEPLLKHFRYAVRRLSLGFRRTTFAPTCAHYLSLPHQSPERQNS
jgi:hypothetical protein